MKNTIEDLTVRHRPLAYKIARLMLRDNEALDEVQSDAMVGLFYAARRFDPSQGRPFGVYARKAIEGGIRRGRQRRSGLTRTLYERPNRANDPDVPQFISLDAPRGPDGSMFLKDMLEAPIEDATLHHVIEELPPRERMVIKLYHLWGLSQSELARIFGLSQMQISRINAKALERLRDLMDPVLQSS